MTTPDSIVIVGAGLGGASTAFELRRLGYAGRLVLIGAEAEPPYERPPLSKGYLRAEESIEKAYVKPAADYDAQAIELLRGRTATAIDVAAKTVSLDDGRRLDYDALVLATGSRPRMLAVAGADRPAVRYLRDVADADAIRADAAKATAIVVVGGGWIGSEVAASLRQLGHAVTIVANRRRPLERVLGGEIAEVYRALHLENGVEIVQGTVVAIGARTVDLSGGGRLPADLVVVGVGVSPRVELAASAGLELRDGGVAVDEFLHTSASGVYAIGDIASAWHPRLRRPLRVEHWDNAKRQGRAVAANVIGAGQPYVRTPYFYSDQFDLGMEYRGFAPRWERVVVRGSLEQRKFHAFWLDDGRVVAAMNANLWDDGDELLALVESDERVDAGRLADPTVTLAVAA